MSCSVNRNTLERRCARFWGAQRDILKRFLSELLLSGILQQISDKKLIEVSESFEKYRVVERGVVIPVETKVSA